VQSESAGTFPPNDSGPYLASPGHPGDDLSVEFPGKSHTATRLEAPRVSVRLLIRGYRERDRPHLLACLASLQDRMAQIDPWNRSIRNPEFGPRAIPFILRHVRVDQGFILVAAADGRPAGVAVAWISRIKEPERSEQAPTRTGYLSDLVVLSDWRGNGIGTRLLREVERRFRRMGCDQMTLGVFEPNRSASRLYRREGFVVRSMHMAKQLGRPKARWPPARGAAVRRPLPQKGR